MTLSQDDIAEWVSRAVTQCLRIDAEAGVAPLDRANEQQGVIDQTAQAIAQGKKPTWAGEHL